MVANISSLETYDVTIIGAGVVGCAMARQFTLMGAKTLILEKASDVLDGASKGNSAILHTGFDAPPGSLEQKSIAEGYQAYHKLAKDFDLPIVKTGAMVLAWDESQQSELPALIEKAKSNGVHDVGMLNRAEILKREPNLSDRVKEGFEVPREFIIDPWASAHSYIMQALLNGAELRRNCQVIGGEFLGDQWHLKTTTNDEGTDNEIITTRHVINCAGLYGDKIDECLLGQKSFTITPRKGQFVVFDKAASDLLSAIILPVPTKTTKGIVICRTVFGNLLVGPTAEDQTSKTDASTDREQLLALHQKGVEMLPALADFEVTTAYAGLRPASEFQDYQIKHHGDKNYTCVGGIRSTGLSSALGIAAYVAKTFETTGFPTAPISNPKIPEIDRLSNYHRRDWQEPDNGGIICHCELVTRREIERAMQGEMPPASLQGLKRRTRATMGRCQGFYCMSSIAKLTQGKFDLPIAQESEGGHE